ncbi:septum formation initiator family protein [Candidatus Bipolaricaulota bacterium]|nr:septum formation initiator family protein [Candidatus Bipolaricaulota bacterium]
MNSFPTWLKVLAATLLILSLVFLYLWQGWQVIYLQRRVSELEEELIPLRERKRELQITVARYFSYDRIERIAKERLGMVEPEIREEEPNS